jgi:hypothetical protein
MNLLDDVHQNTLLQQIILYMIHQIEQQNASRIVSCRLTCILLYLFIYLSVAKPKIGSVNRGGAKTLIRFSRAKLETKI